MKPVLGYIKTYFHEVDKRVLLLVTLWTAILVDANYSLGIDDTLSYEPFLIKFAGRYLVFVAAFAIPYLVFYLNGRDYLKKGRFLLLLSLAPLFFAFKTSAYFDFNLSNDPVRDYYTDQVMYWPLLLLIMMFFMYVIWIWNDRVQPFYGSKWRGINWKPYWLMLLIMIPLIAVASTQQDFLAMYPKIKTITGIQDAGQFSIADKILFELSYGSDFIGIEFFFRGFLILAFYRWAGKDAILPMACFYCTIHFGKPLGECISSYFGGMLLGIVVANTRSVWGGLMVHLGIAWLMEAGGYLGNEFFS